VAVKQQSVPDMAAVRQAHRAGRELRVLRALAAVPPAARAASLCVRLVGTGASASTADADASTGSKGGGGGGAPFFYLALEAAPSGATLLDAAIASGAEPTSDPAAAAAAARFYLGCVLLALRELHTLGIAYRDLKLDNIVLGSSSDGYPRLVDFGLARSVAPAGVPCEACGWSAGGADGCVNLDEAGTLSPSALSAAAEQLARLPCCACNCVAALPAAAMPAGGPQCGPCVRLHRYHSPAESLVHLAKLHMAESAVAGVSAVGAAAAAAERAGAAGGAAVASVPPAPVTSKTGGRERAHSVVGSPAYMAPEVAGGGGHGCAADVWSFGVLAHELLTGVSPFSSRALDAGADEADDVAVDIERRAAAAEMDESALAARAGIDAAALVRAALNPCADLRPCVHALMQHRFFAGTEPGAVADVGQEAEAAARFFAALEARHIAPPPLPSLASASARKGASSSPPPAHFGNATFLACAAAHYEERRQAGLLGGATAADANDVAREFADEAAAGAGEAAVAFE
jgi:serine/threonine protein kinase